MTRPPLAARFRWTAVAAAAIASAGVAPVRAQSLRIVALGDVHGDFDQFVTVLRSAGVIDGTNRWVGGRTHLVQTGDVLDRGADSRKVMDLLIALTGQAEKAGGAVHALVGNHEAMNIQGDLRYVSPGEYAAFRTSGSEALRQRAFTVTADSSRVNEPGYREQWLTEHPLGWVEHRLAFGPNGKYATWIRGNDAVLALGGFLFLHGGIGPAYADSTVAGINAAVRAELAAGDGGGGITADAAGPLWYRGLASDNEDSLAAHVDRVLGHYGVRHIVIGHTVTQGAVMTRFGGRVIMIDVGMSAYYGGPPAALVIEDGVPYALHRGTKLPLPLGGEQLPYLKAAAALDPEGSRLRRFLDQLAVPGTPPMWSGPRPGSSLWVMAPWSIL
ncbi:MAG: metallophosphoesterase [Gemmatimonadales bacterium]